MAKVLAGILTLVINVIAGVFVFVGMLLAMNGFHEADANWGIGAYVVRGAGVSLLMAACAFVMVRALGKRGWNEWGAAALGAAVFSGIGAVLKVVCSVVGVLVADLARTHF